MAEVENTSMEDSMKIQSTIRALCSRIPAAAMLGLLLAAGAAERSEAQTVDPAVNAAADLLRSGDVVRLRIWMEPDLSGDFPVSEQGIAVLPRLGPVPVTGEPVDALHRRITAAYAEFLNHTSIEVVLLRRVQVRGAVKSPGLYHADPSMSVSDVLTLAGGATTNGRTDRIQLIRDGETLASVLSLQTPVGSSPIRSGDQLLVPEKSWALRNPGTIIGAVSVALSFTLALLR
jgi:protein involved in polysaccharide export with SLBB domain